MTMKRGVSEVDFLKLESLENDNIRHHLEIQQISTNKLIPGSKPGRVRRPKFQSNVHLTHESWYEIANSSSIILLRISTADNRISL